MNICLTNETNCSTNEAVKINFCFWNKKKTCLIFYDLRLVLCDLSSSIITKKMQKLCTYTLLYALGFKTSFVT